MKREKKTKPAPWVAAFPSQVKVAPFKRLIVKPRKPTCINRVVTPFEKRIGQMLNGKSRSRKRQTVIRSIRHERENAYRRLKRRWLHGRLCAHCTAQEPSVHHQRGRLGELLIDTRFWIPLCFPCHRNVHDRPEVAREIKVCVDGKWLALLCEKGEWNRLPKELV